MSNPSVNDKQNECASIDEIKAALKQLPSKSKGPRDALLSALYDDIIAAINNRATLKEVRETLAEMGLSMCHAKLKSFLNEEKKRRDAEGVNASQEVHS